MLEQSALCAATTLASRMISDDDWKYRNGLSSLFIRADCQSNRASMIPLAAPDLPRDFHAVLIRASAVVVMPTKAIDPIKHADVKKVDEIFQPMT